MNGKRRQVTPGGLRGGFLNNPPTNRKKCRSCSKATKPASQCSLCQMFVCDSCSTEGADGGGIHECEVCEETFCDECRVFNFCDDSDCKAVQCESCAAMGICSGCNGTFCSAVLVKEHVPGKVLSCGAPCSSCHKFVCPNCPESCQLCSVILCEGCQRMCAKCEDVFCSKCENFLVECEFCDKWYCLICCAKRSRCKKCSKEPSSSQLTMIRARLKTIQSAMTKEGANGARNLSTPSDQTCDKNPLAAPAPVTAPLTRVDMGMPTSSTSAYNELLDDGVTVTVTEMSNGKKKKKKKKVKGVALPDPSPSPGPAPASESFPPLPTAAAPAPVPLPHAFEAGRGGKSNSVDYSVIKAWVESVAAREIKPTPNDIRRYFLDRIDADVIDMVLQENENDCLTTVISCASMMSIDVTVVPETGARARSHWYEEEEDNEMHRSGEGANDDLMGGVFAHQLRGKGRRVMKAMSFDFAESGLERRAREAAANGCKDVKMLEDMLDEARGQPGLAQMRKSMKKLLKKAREAEDEDKKMRKMETVQKLPARPVKSQTNQVQYTSFQPPKMMNSKPSTVMDLAFNVVGWVIGRGGLRIKDIQERTGTQMWVDQNFPDDEPRKLYINGSKNQVQVAIEEINALVETAPVNAHAKENVMNKYFEPAPPVLQPGDISHTLECPHSTVGLVIGKRGITIKQIKATSGAEVEIYQNFPEGMPRKIVVAGPPDTVELALTMIQEIMALDTSSNDVGEASPNGESDSIMSPVSSTGILPQRCHSAPMSTTSEDWGALGNLDGGPLAGGSMGTLWNANPSNVHIPQPLDTNAMINRLHQGNNQLPSVFQGGLQAQPAAPPPPPLQVQPQLAPAPALQPIAAPVRAVAVDQLERQISAAPKEGGEVMPFASVEELLESVGFVKYLPNFLEQEFDVTAVALMEDCDFEEIKVPKGPQLKIQQACRTAGLIMSTTDNSDSEREDDQQVGNSSGGTRAPAAEDVDPEKDLCKICLDAPVEVTFLECGHQVCCFNCAAPMKDCPICREPISRMIKFFRS